MRVIVAAASFCPLSHKNLRHKRVKAIDFHVNNKGSPAEIQSQRITREYLRDNPARVTPAPP